MRSSKNFILQGGKGGSGRQTETGLGENGLEALNGQYELVLIHDGVRPMVEPAWWRRSLRRLQHRAAIAALPAKETVKAVNEPRQVTATYDRAKVWMVQTPQAFYYEDILKAHRKPWRKGLTEATDDAFLVEQLGIPVSVVPGSERNIKVTTPHDLALANFYCDWSFPAETP
jgi:2-C-methyl-D-erythritol 4-phosphate cytidylyltransferase